MGNDSTTKRQRDSWLGLVRRKSSRHSSTLEVSHDVTPVEPEKQEAHVSGKGCTAEIFSSKPSNPTSDATEGTLLDALESLNHRISELETNRDAESKEVLNDPAVPDALSNLAR